MDRLWVLDPPGNLTVMLVYAIGTKDWFQWWIQNKESASPTIFSFIAFFKVMINIAPAPYNVMVDWWSRF